MGAIGHHCTADRLALIIIADQIGKYESLEAKSMKVECFKSKVENIFANIVTNAIVCESPTFCAIKYLQFMICEIKIIFETYFYQLVFS